MKYNIIKLLAILIGIIIGFFGVINSVFSDGALAERLITISIILAIYAILSALLGFLLPAYSWAWGLLLCIPGVLFLFLYMFTEFNPYYLIYIITLISVSCLGAYGGNKIKAIKKGREQIKLTKRRSKDAENSTSFMIWYVWIQDRYGLSWQIVPETMGEFLSSGTKDEIKRVTEAFLKMKKIDIALLEKAKL